MIIFILTIVVVVVVIVVIIAVIFLFEFDNIANINYDHIYVRIVLKNYIL